MTEDYRKEILDMVSGMTNLRFLEMVYGFVKRLYLYDGKGGAV